MTVFISGGVNPPNSPPPPPEKPPRRFTPVATTLGALGTATRGTTRLGRWLYRQAVGDVFMVATTIALASIPLLHSYHVPVLDKIIWVWIWFFLFLIKTLRDLYTKGKITQVGESHVLEVHSAVAGSVESIAGKLTSSTDKSLGEEQTKALCAGLLHRIKDYVRYALKAKDEVRLRVTLAVPWRAPSETGPLNLRVWCYDQTYEDRRWTTLALPTGSETPLPGSPSAYVTGRTQIISDVHEIVTPHSFRDRRFRSVLSVPVHMEGPGGLPIAVVNIDATVPDFFQAKRVEEVVLPLIAPAVTLLGLVLTLRRKESKYVFGN